ncbi:MAG: c-type cytochrome [Zavarzinella sp.]
MGAPPYLWHIENNNDKPGKFEVLLSGFGSEDTHETLNTFQWGPDGWLYGLHGVFTHSNVKQPGNEDAIKMNAAVWRYHPTRKKFEIFSEGTSNPWGMDWRNQDGQFILACCVIPHLYHMVPGGIYRRQAGASFNPYAYDYIPEICDHTFHRESGWAHAGLIALDAPHIPKKYHQNVIFGSIHGCSVKQNKLTSDGASFKATREDDFLISGDKNVRPINLKWAPNGEIYLSDWHDQNPCHQALPESWDYQRGRIYRIKLKSATTTVAPDLSKLTRKELFEFASYRNKKFAVVPDWLRDISEDDPWLNRQIMRLISEEAARQPFKMDQLLSNAAWNEVTFAGSDWFAAFVKTKPNTTQLAIAVRSLGNKQTLSKADLTALDEVARTNPDVVVLREMLSLSIRFPNEAKLISFAQQISTTTGVEKDRLLPYLAWFALEKQFASDAQSITDQITWLIDQAPKSSLVREQLLPKTIRRLVAKGDPQSYDLCLEIVEQSRDNAVRKVALNALVKALEGRTIQPPKKWFTLQVRLNHEADKDLTKLLDQLAVHFRDPAALQRAFNMATSAKASVSERAEGLRAVVLLKHPQALQVCQEFAKQSTNPELQLLAIRLLPNFSDSKVATTLVEQWAASPTVVQSEILNVLASRKEWAKVLLSAMSAKKIDRMKVSDNVITRIQSFGDSELEKLISSAWGKTRPTSADLLKVIDQMREELDRTPASYERGKKVFEAQCAKCHKFDGKGAEVGPALDGAARDIEYILGNVIDPNRVIGAPYFMRTIILLDGRNEAGLLAEEDAQSITIKGENGTLKRFERKDIDTIKVQEKSLMPEGLTAGMSKQDFRDLVRYVMVHPYVNEYVVNGKPVSLGTSGFLKLSPTSGTESTSVKAKIESPKTLTTNLLLSVVGQYEVFMNGKQIAKGNGLPKDSFRPDDEAYPVQIQQGENILEIRLAASKNPAALTARFQDSERLLKYPESTLSPQVEPKSDWK